MARPKILLEPYTLEGAEVVVSNAVTRRYLAKLLRMGTHGRSIPEVADRLMDFAINQLIYEKRLEPLDGPELSTWPPNDVVPGGRPTKGDE